MNTPIVSILMTAYNREKYIAEAIDSVLASSLKDFELIIVDDTSKDKTVEIAQSFAARDKRVKVFVNEKNLGDYPNRNQAAAHAAGKYIKYLDADDMIYPYGLEVMVDAMERFPGAGFGLAALADDHKPFPILLQPKEAYMENFFGRAHFDRAPGSSIILNEAFKKMNGFSGKRMIGDYEFWFKIGRYYPMVKFPFDLYWNRLHDMQESKTEYAKKLYFSLRKNVCSEALQHPDCPLSSKDLELVKKRIRKQNQKYMMHHVFGKLNRLTK